MISSVKWGRTGAATAVLIAILTPTHAAGLAFQSALEGETGSVSGSQDGDQHRRSSPGATPFHGTDHPTLFQIRIVDPAGCAGRASNARASRSATRIS